MSLPTINQIAEDLVSWCNEGRDMDVVNAYFSETTVSIEGPGDDGECMRSEGIAAIREKHNWWTSNHEVHETRASGPYKGHAPNQFAVQFYMDITPNGGTRRQATELGVYTATDGKLAKEEFRYQH